MKKFNLIVSVRFLMLRLKRKIKKAEPALMLMLETDLETMMKD